MRCNTGTFKGKCNQCDKDTAADKKVLIIKQLQLLLFDIIRNL